MNEHRYPAADVAAIERVIRERRDIRQFAEGALPEGLLGRLIEAAHRAPSVGYMQPWRFVRIVTAPTREALWRIVDVERLVTAASLPTRAAAFLKLKIDGIREAAEVLVVALMPDREAHIFGRRTMPEMDLASTACAIQNMWLLARAEGVGLGWVSFFDPEAVSDLLEMPAGSRPIAILCLGPVAEFPPQPVLESKGWGSRLPLDEVLFEDRWRAGAGGTPTAY
ncbi:5,6-dimethylbenzimidazole synthase [Candidatus Accumulibacter phosphatis]|jgi:5,6-dimethylbenzimidazole synthase|uniref:5,6-dimethylbenzimidazole synthase n=1 Tax=Candidatus Accumulibacter phosphatis TaxID=327160 RepID=A0ABX1TUL0_9PROT|nr:MULTISPECIES: 5,6-dimethylbenzimidazole synthase [Candidatus Accumulibacter]NMQ27959.1 5,6-dimethylbenzimidazole synthase [Candidatus Accumulibacter phosphatis]